MPMEPTPVPLPSGELEVLTPDGCTYTKPDGGTTSTPYDGKGRPNNGSTGDWDVSWAEMHEDD